MHTNNITLGGKQVYDPPEGIVGLNRFVMRTGASRYGHGAFVMIRRDYDALVNDSSGGISKLVMDGQPGPGLTLSVVVAGAEVLISSPSSDRSSDVVKVVVYDRRSQSQYIKKAYNVVLPGFPVDGSNNFICYATTYDPETTQQWEWDKSTGGTGIFEDIGLSAAHIPEDIPTWTPYNLAYDNVPNTRVIDDVAGQLFYIVGFDFDSGSYALFPPASGFSDNDTLYNNVLQTKALLSGGLALRNVARLPKNITATFPGVTSGQPFGTARVYTKSIPSGFSGSTSDVTLALQIGSYPALYKPGAASWANQMNLDEIAADMVPRFCAFISQDFLQEEFAGIWPFKPDGKYRQVEWTSDQYGARTIVKSDNTKDWLPTDQISDPINGTSPQLIQAIGGMQSSISQEGQSFFWQPRSVFLITGTATVPHLYVGSTFMPSSTAPNHAQATEFSVGDLGNSLGDTVYLYNVTEQGRSPSETIQWDLNYSLGLGLQPIVQADFWCTMDNGTPLYLIRTVNFKNCP